MDQMKLTEKHVALISDGSTGDSKEFARQVLSILSDVGVSNGASLEDRAETPEVHATSIRSLREALPESASLSWRVSGMHLL